MTDEKILFQIKMYNGKIYNYGASHGIMKIQYCYSTIQHCYSAIENVGYLLVVTKRYGAYAFMLNEIYSIKTFFGYNDSELNDVMAWLKKHKDADITAEVTKKFWEEEEE